MINATEVERDQVSNVMGYVWHRPSMPKCFTLSPSLKQRMGEVEIIVSKNKKSC